MGESLKIEEKIKQFTFLINMESNHYKEYKGGFFKRLMYTIQPWRRLSKNGSLETYEDGKWIPATDSKKDIRKELGNDIYDFYARDIINRGYEDRVLMWIEMKTWARWARKSQFTLIGLSLTFFGLIFNFPLFFIGVPLSLLSLYLNFQEISKPMFPKKQGS